MSGRAFGGPEMYVQRVGEVERLERHAQELGQNALIVIDGFLEHTYAPRFRSSFEASGTPIRIERFGGECTAEEINRLVDAGCTGRIDVVIAFGGGKTADTVKLVANELKAKVMIVPTIASTDAPCSAVAVRYTRAGAVDRIFSLPRHPDRVIVDPSLIVQAPARFLIAGMGDALSTWFEARSNRDTRSMNYIGEGYHAPLAALAIARQCHDVLMCDGLQAKAAAEAGRITPALENVIEANTLLSGLGFENCGVSAAHGIHNGLTVLHQTHSLMHGEKVAFGVLVLLILEGRPQAEFEETLRFCRAVGLPTRLSDLNLGDCTDEELERVAIAALRDGEATRTAFGDITVRGIVDAIRTLDRITTD
ncbi:MAG: glycerol dehydrogenase [Rhizobiaceae bacterium]|nr:glycerol dehydrogenase [Rhizobiaceae bacterium]